MSGNVSMEYNNTNSYTVEEIDSCMCFFGSIPIDVYTNMASLDRFKDAVMSTQISRILGASVVIGLEEHVNSLLEKLKADPKYNSIKLANVSNEANEWYVFGEQGVSSATMFEAVFDEKPYGWNKMTISLGKTPSDSDDLSRCIKLYNLVPEVRDHFYKIRKISNAWNNIYIHWEKLCKLYKEERFNEVNELLDELNQERVEN